MPATRRIAGVLVCLLVLADHPSIGAQQQSPTQPPTFRSRVTLVPVDVRVIDRRGRPVTGLRQQDFVITEDDVPQPIVHFSFTALRPMAAPPGPPELRRPAGEPLEPQTARTFLFVLGRGRQVGPGKDVRAAVDFIRTRLLPQDQVAILAYNRTTPFTTDHESAARTLESYFERHELIEARLAQYFSGLAMAFADPEIPPRIQRLVDDIFEQPGTLEARHVPPGDITDRVSLDEEIARSAGPALADVEWIEAGLHRNSPTIRDLESLYAGITSMRYLEGEKHLVFLTPQGLALGNLDNASALGRLASDARVAIDVVHTYGMIGAPPATPWVSFSVPTAGMVFAQRFKIENSRHISELTGGETAAFKYGADTFERLDRTTRAQYLLGYAPVNTDREGDYRRIRVTVNRRDVKVIYRRGYFAREHWAPGDRKTFLTFSRIASAAKYYQPIEDITITLDRARLGQDAAGPAVAAIVRVAPAAIEFSRRGDLYTATLDALFACLDGHDRRVGDVTRTLDFTLTEESYQKYLRDGLTFDVNVPVAGEAERLKVVVYDYRTDAVGSRDIEVKR
jgi:VWFA-related protein